MVGALVGGAFMAGFAWLMTKFHVSAHQLGWSGSLAIWLGVTFFGVGSSLYFVSFNRREVARSLEGETAKLPATDQEVRAFRLQRTTLMLAGILLLLPILAQGWRWPGMIFSGLVVLFALQTMTNILLWRSSDEFLRGQMLMVGAVTFAVGQGALFLWAAAERLQLVRAISSRDIITLLMTLYLMTGSYVALKNRPGC